MATGMDAEMMTLSAPGGPTGFSLRRMDSAPIPAQFVHPHRHALNEIMIVSAGRSGHVIDGQPVDFRDNSVCYIPKDHVHLLEPDATASGWLLQFSDDFLPTPFIDRGWDCRTALVRQFGSTHTVDLPKAEVDRLERMMELMEAEYLGSAALREQSLRHWLSLLILRLVELGRPRGLIGTSGARGLDLYLRFTALLERDFVRHHNVGHYLAHLNTSAAHLSRILAEVVGKTGKAMIEERIMLEAKRSIMYSEKSLKEIAFTLGYADQFHFSRTFKRVAGMSPSDFRELAIGASG